MRVLVPVPACALAWQRGSVLIFGLFDVVSQRQFFFFFYKIQIESAGDSIVEALIGSDGV